MKQLTVIIPFIVLLLLPVPASFAETYTEQLKGATISLPIPDGFVDTRKVSQEFTKAMLAFVPANNRSLGILLPKQDVLSISMGKNPGYVTNISYQIRREIEARDISMRQFKMQVEMLQSQYRDLSKQIHREMDDGAKDSSKTFSDYIERDFSVSIGEIKTLDLYSLDDNHFSVLMLQGGETVTDGVKTKISAISSMSFLHIKQRIIYACVSQEFQGKESVQELKALADKVSKDILATN